MGCISWKRLLARGRIHLRSSKYSTSTTQSGDSTREKEGKNKQFEEKHSLRHPLIPRSLLSISHIFKTTGPNTTPILVETPDIPLAPTTTTTTPAPAPAPAPTPTSAQAPAVSVPPLLCLSIPSAEIIYLTIQLSHSLTTLHTLLAMTRNQTLSDIAGILELTPPDSLVHTQLQILSSRISQVFVPVLTIFSARFEPVLTVLPEKWAAFLALPREEQGVMTGRQRGGGKLMGMFDVLAGVRRGCEEVLEVQKRVEREVALVSDEVLRGLNNSAPQEARMKWRVLGVVVPRRGTVVGNGVEDVLRERVTLSTSLVGVVEGFSESL